MYVLEFMGVGDWEMVLLAMVCEGEGVSPGERCLGHRGGGKERIEGGLKGRKEPGTVNALR